MHWLLHCPALSSPPFPPLLLSSLPCSPPPLSLSSPLPLFQASDAINILVQEPLLPGEEPREGDEPRLDHIGVDGVVEAEVVHCLGSHELGT